MNSETEEEAGTERSAPHAGHMFDPSLTVALQMGQITGPSSGWSWASSRGCRRLPVLHDTAFSGQKDCHRTPSRGHDEQGSPYAALEMRARRPPRHVPRHGRAHASPRASAPETAPPPQRDAASSPSSSRAWIGMRPHAVRSRAHRDQNQSRAAWCALASAP